MTKAILTAFTLIALSAPSFAAVKKLQPASIIAAKSNRMFPTQSVQLTAQIPCWQQVEGTVQSTNSRGEAVLGVLVSGEIEPGQIVCQSESQQNFKFNLFSEIVQKLEILGAVPGLVVEDAQ